MKKILGLFFVLAGLFCFNSCKNYIDQLSIAGNKYKMTEAIPVSKSISATAGLNLVAENCILTFNKDGSSYTQTQGSGSSASVVSQGNYEVSTSDNNVTLIDSSGGRNTYYFSDQGTVLHGSEYWTGSGFSGEFSVTYRLQ